LATPTPFIANNLFLLLENLIFIMKGLFKKAKEKGSKGIFATLKPSYSIVWKTPPSHFRPQKVRDFVGRFLVNVSKSTAQMVAGLEVLSRRFSVRFSVSVWSQSYDRK
jgi:hypothetical protein